MRNIDKYLTAYLQHLLSLKQPGLTPQLVLMARFLAIMVLTNDILPFGRQIPYFDFINRLGNTIQFNNVMLEMFRLSALLIIFTPLIRIGSFVAGCTFLFSLFACRPCLSVAHTFMSAIFIVIGLSNHSTGNSLVKIQLIILYFGALANKLFYADWWTGDYMETLLITRHQVEIYQRVAALFPPKALSAALGILSIFFELFVGICFIVKKLYKTGILICVAFHTIMIIMLGTAFGPFYFTLAFSYLVFTNWPWQITVNNSLLLSLANKLHLQNLFPHIVFNSGIKNKLQLTIAGESRNYYGYTALLMFFFCLPVTFYAIAYISPLGGALLWIKAFHLLMLPLYWCFLNDYFKRKKPSVLVPA